MRSAHGTNPASGWIHDSRLACLLAAPATAQWEYEVEDVTALVQLLSSDQAVLRQLAATGLGLADPFFASLGVPALRDQLQDEDEQARLAAAWALGRLGDVGPEGLGAALVNEDPRVLVAAAEGLARSGLPAAEVIAAGFGYVGQKPLEEYDEAEQQAIAAAVEIARHVWDSDLEPVAAMLDAVADIEDSEASMYEIQLLEAMAQAIAREEDNAVPILLDALDSDNPTVRGVTVLALGDLAPDSRVFLPRMIDLLGDDSYYVRRMSAYAIGRLGPAAADAIPYLIDNIPEPEDWRNDWPVSGALADIGAAAVPALLELLGDQDDEDRRYIAAHALEMMGPPGREALPELFAVHHAGQRAGRPCRGRDCCLRPGHAGPAD